MNRDNAQGAEPIRAASGPASSEKDQAKHKALVEQWVDQHAHYLLGYALPRVRDRFTAEELVQETFLSALKAVATFKGASSARTWLVTLLRRRVADHYRKVSREMPAESIDAVDPTIDDWFDSTGSWIKWPRRCELDPAALRERADFWRVVENCLKALPERLAAAFSLRVMERIEPNEVCNILSISPTNLAVMLHRARARLRSCLEVHWFESQE